MRGVVCKRHGLAGYGSGLAGQDREGVRTRGRVVARQARGLAPDAGKEERRLRPWLDVVGLLSVAAALPLIPPVGRD